jgi:hypothetical protein
MVVVNQYFPGTTLKMAAPSSEKKYCADLPHYVSI